MAFPWNDPGVAYREWSVPGASLTDKNWQFRSTRGQGAQKSTFRGLRSGRKGARSLVELAAQVTAKNIQEASVEALKSVPIHLLRFLWGYIQQERPCFHAWKLFTEVLGAHEEEVQVSLDIYRFHQQIQVPHSELSVYTKPLLSPAFDFLVSLSIVFVATFTTNELLSLTSVKNLGVLEIVHQGAESDAHQVDDRLLKGWTEQPDPFPVLRVLRLKGMFDLTEESIPHASKFPSLAVYDVSVHRGKWYDYERICTAHSWAEVFGQESLVHLSEEKGARASFRDTFIHIEKYSSRPGKPKIQLQSEWWDQYLSGMHDYATLQLSSLPARTHLETSQPSVGEVPDHFLSPELRSKRDFAWEGWGLGCFAGIGKAISDRDIRTRAVPIKADVFPLPNTPFACLRLGTVPPSNLYAVLGRDRAHHTLVRLRHDDNANETKETKDDEKAQKRPNPPSRPKLKAKKRQMLGDMFSSF